MLFRSPNDPRMLSTLDAIRRPLVVGGLAADGLVYRYDPAAAPDGLAGQEGTFNMCSFWLVEALTRAGRTDPARLLDVPEVERLDHGLEIVGVTNAADSRYRTASTTSRTSPIRATGCRPARKACVSGAARSLQAHARPHHVVDVARPGRQPKRFSALMISATATGTIGSQAASPPWIRARTSGVRIDRYDSS